MEKFRFRFDKFLRAGFGLLIVLAAVTACFENSATHFDAGAGAREWVAAEELKFGDFFKLPVGPKGLDPTERLLGLHGRRVRVSGYMVREEQPQPGLLILTPTPTFLADVEDGPADYLPPASLFVHLPAALAGQLIRYAPGPWSMSGTLQVGGTEEPNGRVSHVRLMLDDAPLILAPEGKSPVIADAGAHGRRQPR